MIVTACKVLVLSFFSFFSFRDSLLSVDERIRNLFTRCGLQLYNVVRELAFKPRTAIGPLRPVRNGQSNVRERELLCSKYDASEYFTHSHLL